METSNRKLNLEKLRVIRRCTKFKKQRKDQFDRFEFLLLNYAVKGFIVQNESTKNFQNIPEMNVTFEFILTRDTVR